MSSKTITARNRRLSQKRKQQRWRLAATGMIVLGALLLSIALLWYYTENTSVTNQEFNFQSAEVAFEQPLQAIHEMGAGPAIPFLPKDSPQPQIALDSDFHDFGTIGPQDVVTQEFFIANLGDAPLTISRAYTTCGCTTADITSAVIPPGMVSVMTVIFDAGFHDVSGQTVRRGVIIESNDPSRSLVEIWVEVSVRN